MQASHLLFRLVVLLFGDFELGSILEATIFLVDLNQDMPKTSWFKTFFFMVSSFGGGFGLFLNSSSFLLFSSKNSFCLLSTRILVIRIRFSMFYRSRTSRFMSCFSWREFPELLLAAIVKSLIPKVLWLNFCLLALFLLIWWLYSSSLKKWTF